MKKYIPVFGPQELFDGAENCDEYLVAVQHSVGQKTKVSFYPSLVEAFNYVTDFPPRGVVFHRAAMRRIEEMQEPKRWTWEDKKAGRLPEVLGKVTTYDGKPYSFVGESCHDNQWSIKDDETRKVYHIAIDLVLPIETPAEKAQREEDEFVDSTCRQNEPHSTLYSDGVRAAYRKLKGGE
jgi:hypothetical protein